MWLHLPLVLLLGVVAPHRKFVQGVIASITDLLLQVCSHLLQILFQVCLHLVLDLLDNCFGCACIHCTAFVEGVSAPYFQLIEYETQLSKPISPTVHTMHLKDQCPTCKRKVKWTEAGVCCDKCDYWFHATCQGINNDKYEKLMDDESDWMCNNCKPPTPKHPQRKRSLKIGTLNCRGLRSELKGEAKRQHIAEDMSSYDLDILAL